MLEKKIALIMLIVSAIIEALCLALAVGMGIYWLAVLIVIGLAVDLSIIWDEVSNWHES